jgi:predicted dehydrogenase
MANRSSRREFMKISTVAGIGFWVAAGSAARESKSSNEQIAMASIGIGGKGSSDSEDAANNGRMVAICDVDENRLNSLGENKFPDAKRYTDFRKMLEEMGGRIDAVTISTPDHTHAPAALMAMRMGKHCFCQKPLARTIYETRLMAQVAKEMKVATQMGNQGTAESGLRRSAAFIKAGGLGTVKEVHVWTNRPVWPQGAPRPKSNKCPGNLKWNQWLGSAPVRPFSNGVYHPLAWRGWWDFGCGALGDMACHTMNMPYMGLNLRNPTAAQAETSGHNGDFYPSKSKIVHEFAESEGRPALKLHWYDGGYLPDAEIVGEGAPIAGCLVVGEKGKLFSGGDYGDDMKLIGVEMPSEVKYVESPGHFEEWIRAIKGGEPAMSNFSDYAGPLTEMALLGNLAVWVAATGTGERIEWDAQNMKCTNIAGLESLVKPIYRAGYALDA